MDYIYNHPYLSLLIGLLITQKKTNLGLQSLGVVSRYRESKLPLGEKRTLKIVWKIVWF